MSARICSECASPYLAVHGPEYLCELCGWIGLPASGLEWGHRDFMKDASEKLALVKSGKLFMVRATLAGELAQVKSDTLQLMKILDVKKLHEIDKKDEYLRRAEVLTRPTAETIGTIKMLKSVVYVRVHP